MEGMAASGPPPGSTRGRLLVAPPGLRDPSFARTVVLMLEHGDDGAVGLVLNRPTDVRLADALADWAAVGAAPACLFVGGPVQPEALVALGMPRPGGPAEPPGLVPLFDGLGSVDLEADSAAFGAVRVFVGYAGWAAGQLDAELAAGGWIVLDRLPEDVLSSDPSGLWRAVLRRQRGRLAMFASAPADPSVN